MLSADDELLKHLHMGEKPEAIARIALLITTKRPVLTMIDL